MARIKFSAIGITNIIGKAGGTIFSRNRGGAYVKNFVKPSNPQTARQQAVRGLFGMLSTMWRALLPDYQAAWNAASINYPVLNKFGDTVFLSGKALFQKLNGNLSNAGGVLLDFPLLPVGAVAPKAVPAPIIEETGGILGSLSVQVDFTDTVSGRVVYEATRPMNAGKSAQNSDYRLIKTAAIAAANTQTTDIAVAYTAQFGSAAEAGSFIHVRAFLVVPTGEASARVSGKGEISEV